jgi:hypothetical protein
MCLINFRQKIKSHRWWQEKQVFPHNKVLGCAKELERPCFFLFSTMSLVSSSACLYFSTGFQLSGSSSSVSLSWPVYFKGLFLRPCFLGESSSEEEAGGIWQTQQSICGGDAPKETLLADGVVCTYVPLAQYEDYNMPQTFEYNMAYAVFHVS